MAYAAVAISLMALAFTIGSFWWLHARRGRVISFEPQNWAAHLNRNRSALRLPLVLHNTGASVVVVLALRVRFREQNEVLNWEWTRKTVNPGEDDVEDVASPFSITGGGSRDFVPEFVGQFPGTVPKQRFYPLLIEAQTSHRARWHEVAAFDINFGNLVHPSNYITYTSQPDYLDEQQLKQGAERLAKLREQWGLERTQ